MYPSTLNFSAKREQFAGANKTSASLLTPLERRLARAFLPRIPAWIETQHLTLLTLVWCALIIAFSHLAAANIRWLWLVSLMIVCQYVTDFFDGKLGKYRDTGLVKWGFYMDHLLDYVFLCAVLFGYALVLPENSRTHLFLMLAVFGGYMVNSFLAFAATAEFKISHLKLGPTEFRIALIIINTLVILCGTKPMAKALPYVAWGALAGLCLLVYGTQREIWRRDMELKSRRAQKPPQTAATRTAA